MTCWSGEKPECRARWIVCSENMLEEAGDLLEAYGKVSLGNINVKMINDGEIIRYAYVNSKGSGFVLEIDPGVMEPGCLGPVKSALVDKLTVALMRDPRWQLIYHIIERQMLPTP